MENSKQENTKSILTSQKLWSKIRNIIKKENGKVVFQSQEKLFYQIYQKNIEQDMIYYHIPSLESPIIIKFIDSITLLISQRLPQSSISIGEAQDLNKNKVDSTGIKLWPAEEIMAYYVSQNLDLFKRLITRGKKVIELGAGYSGLASLVLAFYMLKQGFEFDVTITDGLDICVDRIQENIALNTRLQKNCNISFQDEVKFLAEEKLVGSINVKKVVWSKDAQLEHEYDVILLSDCLFFKNFHLDLEATLYELLTDKPESCCILANPARGDSEKKFFEVAEKRFKISEVPKDDFLQKQIEELKLQPRYDEDTDNIKIYMLHKIKN